MSAISRTRRHLLAGTASVLLALSAVLAVAAAAASAAAAQSAAPSGYVKYYVVQSTFGDQPEDLAEAILMCVTLPERTVVEEIVLSPTRTRDQSRDLEVSRNLGASPGAK